MADLNPADFALPVIPRTPLADRWPDLSHGPSSNRTIWTCTFCAAWQLDTGSHEARPVVEAILLDHVAEHGYRSARAAISAWSVAADHARDVERRLRWADTLKLAADLELWARLNLARSSPGRKVLDVHALDLDVDGDYERPRCRVCGCEDCGGYEDTAWPCATVRIFVEAAGLTVPAVTS